MIRITFSSRRSEAAQGRRFVKKEPRKSGYRWCIQDAAHPEYDVQQGTCEAEDLPADIRAVCDAYSGAHYACEWPPADQPKDVEARG